MTAARADSFSVSAAAVGAESTGGTMSEKGVSQLVSVDLECAVALRDGEAPEEFTAAEKALEDMRA